MARDLYCLYTNTYNFETEAHTDFKYVPIETSKIALHEYLQNSKSVSLVPT